MLARTITILFIVTSLLSCSKDDSPYNSAYNPGIMSAYVAGNLWYANEGYYQTPNATSLQMYADFNGQSHISISIGNYTGPGSYFITGFNGADYYDGNGLDYAATSGSLTVTSDNGTQILGTFQFAGFSTVGGYPINITGGQFRLTK